MSATMPKPTGPDAFDIAASIAPELRPLAIDRGRNEQLRCSVIDRVRQSALAHRAFTTVRREDAAWLETSPGVRQRSLSAVGGLRVEVLQLAPEAPIAWPRDAHAQEVLVVGGELTLSAAGQPPIQLSPLNLVVLARDAAWHPTAGPAGATLYVRHRTVGLEHLPAAEAQWWTSAQGASLCAAAAGCPWSSYLEGVDAAVLHAHGDVASMLIRIAPGGAAPDHGHKLNEDCFMLEGDMFLGDILMRPGDYQLAPVGCQHVGISSDTGGLFYFHGAIPPSESEQSP